MNPLLMEYLLYEISKICDISFYGSNSEMKINWTEPGRFEKQIGAIRKKGFKMEWNSE